MPRVLAAWEARHPTATRRTIDALFLGYYAGLILTGVVALFGTPSPSASAVLEWPWATWLWAGGTSVMAAIAIAGRVWRSVDAETIALASLALLTVLHGAMLIIGSEGWRGAQTGVRLLASPLLMLAVAHELRRPTVRVKALGDGHA